MNSFVEIVFKSGLGNPLMYSMSQNSGGYEGAYSGGWYIVKTSDGETMDSCLIDTYILSWTQ